MNPQADQHSVLLVDDEASIRFAVGEFLSANGYTVDAAESRADAEALFAAHAHDIVITDLKLTGNDPRGGLELIRTVRARAPHATTILMTAYGCTDLAAEAAELGCDVVLSKPAPLGTIIQALSERHQQIASS